MGRSRSSSVTYSWVLAGLVLSACRADAERPDAGAAAIGGGAAQAQAGAATPATAPNMTPAQATAPLAPGCGSWPPGSSDRQVPLRACVMSAELPRGSELPFGPASPVLEFRGTVLELDDVTPDEHCLGYIALNGVLLKTVNEQLDPRWLRAEDDAGQRIEIGVLAPEFSWPVVVGDRVSVIVELEAPGFAALPRQQLTVRSSSGELLGWFGEAYELEQLHTPRELQLSLGDVACLGHHHCSPTWAEHELRARIDGDDRELSFGHYEKIMLGDYAIVHGGVYKDLEGAHCPESGIDRASAGLWRVR